MSRFFLGGVSGAGKTTLIQACSDSGASFGHLVAGALIKAGLDREKGGYRRPRVRDEEEADRFQLILIDEWRRVTGTMDGPIVLDGHYVVPTEEGPSDVAPWVFEELGVAGLALVEAPASVIAARLADREPEPRWWDGTVDQIDDLCRRERVQAELVAASLGMRLQVVEGVSDLVTLTRLRG